MAKSVGHFRQVYALEHVRFRQVSVYLVLEKLEIFLWYDKFFNASDEMKCLKSTVKLRSGAYLRREGGYIH